MNPAPAPIRVVSAAPIRVVSAARPPRPARAANDGAAAKPQRGRDDGPLGGGERAHTDDAGPRDRADAKAPRRADDRHDADHAGDADRGAGDRRAEGRADQRAARRADAAGDGDGARDGDSAAASPAPPRPEPPALRAPHRDGAQSPPAPPTGALAELRELVGRRDARDSFAAVAAWSRDLGAPLAATSGPELVSWAAEARRLYPATEPPRPGDLLVFDQVTSDDASDLVALVIDRDERGVAELLYLGGGVVRRGLVDASRPAVHRDARGATVNTYLRHGRRWPAQGMHYLAGELLAHVVRVR